MPRGISKPKPEQFEKSLRGTLAYNIRYFRAEKKVSQEELAFRCELDRTYISAVERANSGATWTRIPRQTGQRFQRKLDTDSTPNWTVK
jgi:DNA-binding XRE family transcriptional regulator